MKIHVWYQTYDDMRFQFEIYFQCLLNYTLFTIVKGYQWKPSRNGPVGPPKRDKVSVNDKERSRFLKKLGRHLFAQTNAQFRSVRMNDKHTNSLIGG